MKRFTISFAIVVLLWNTIYTFGQSDNNCSNNEEVATLEIQLDQNADETGYKLVCDGVTVWDVPIGTLADQSAGEWKVERSCIRNDVAICNFTISDDGRDGITGSENGFLTLSFGASTVAFLEYGKVAPFTEHSFCFGTGCDDKMIEEMEDDEVKEKWKIVNFNDTSMPNSNRTDTEENESNFDDAGVWVVNVTNKPSDKSDDESRSENGNWVVNVTIFENEDDPNNDTDVNPNDKVTTPQTNDSVGMSSSESYTPSASSLVIIICVIGSIVVVMLIVAFLYKRKGGRHAIDRDISYDTAGPVLLVHTTNKSGKNAHVDDNDDEKSKNSSNNDNDNVHEAETFVTYDSSDSTVVQQQPHVYRNNCK